MVKHQRVLPHQEEGQYWSNILTYISWRHDCVFGMLIWCTSTKFSIILWLEVNDSKHSL